MAVDPVLSVRHLQVELPTDQGVLKAVDDVSFDVARNEVLGIVGESGSGKTVTALSVLGLLPKRARIRGEVLFDGRDLLTLRERDLQAVRGARIAIIFQDALASLNPVITVGRQVGEAIRVHGDVSPKDAEERALELLDIVGIANPRRRAGEYPHEYSGGMRQRAMIAMALANDPDVLIADEPTTALDVTIQAQVLDVFERVRERTNSSLVLITHDLGIVAGVADRVVVMYAGTEVEAGSTDEIFYESRHPYTLALLASIPRVDRDGRTRRLHQIKGQPPSLISVPPGCAFHPRCPAARLPDPCATDRPLLRDVGSGHSSACHFAEILDAEQALVEEPSGP
jgi:oligopeptide/dipeptide ABC transporter ATP-binding protein